MFMQTDGFLTDMKIALFLLMVNTYYDHSSLTNHHVRG